MRHLIRYAHTFWRLVVFAAALAAVLGCENTEKKEAESPVAVKTVEIATGTLFRRLGYTGDIEGRTEIRVFSPIPERIVSLSVVEGDRVERGDVLAVVRSKALTQGVRQAAGGLDAARAQRAALEDQVTRITKLVGSGAASSAQLLAVESQLAAAEAQVRQLEAALGQAKQMRGDAVIQAPVDGLIGQVFVEVGDLAAPQIPICTVVDMDVVTIKVRVPETDLTSVAEGQPVTFRVLSSDGAEYEAAVTRVSPVLDRMSRTATLEIDYDNRDHALKPGMLTRVEVEVERRDGVVWAPKDALTVMAERKGEEQLYRAVVVRDGKAVERKVLLGLIDGLKAQVLEGLSPGELLATEGQHLLADGDPVSLQDGSRSPSSQPAAGVEGPVGERPEGDAAEETNSKGTTARQPSQGS